MSFRKLRIVEVDGIRPGIEGDTRQGGSCNISDDTNLSNSQFVIAIEHSLTAFTIGCNQDGIFILRVKKEDAHVIKIKLLADRRGDLRKEILQALCLIDHTQDL